MWCFPTLGYKRNWRGYLEKMRKYSNWKKAFKIIISAFFVLCVMGSCNAPDLESITLSADTATTHDINEEIKIKQNTNPDNYSLSASDFKATGGEIKSKDGTIYFVSSKAGTFEIYARSSGVTSNTLTFKIEDKNAIAKAKEKKEEEAKKKAEEEQKKKEEQEKKEKEKAAKKAEQEKIAAEKAEQERIAAEQAAQQAEQERIAAEQAAQQQAQQPVQQPATTTYVLNTSTGKFHYSSCRDVSKISPENYMAYEGTRDELINQSYSPCGHCHP